MGFADKTGSNDISTALLSGNDQDVLHYKFPSNPDVEYKNEGSLMW